MDYKTETFVCLFCGTKLPEPENYDNSHKCPNCGAAYGFVINPKETGDAWEFYLDEADALGIPDGNPQTRIGLLEAMNRQYDVLDEGTDSEEPVYVYFVRKKP